MIRGKRRLRSGLRGESLVETLVTVAILGLAVTALIGGLGSSVTFSALHREQASANATIHSFAEDIQASVASGAYTECADTLAYGTGFESEMTTKVVNVEYWNGSAFVAKPAWCTGSNKDTGVQRLTLEVSGDRVAQDLELVVRKPCKDRGNSPASSGAPC